MGKHADPRGHYLGKFSTDNCGNHTRCLLCGLGNDIDDARMRVR